MSVNVQKSDHTLQKITGMVDYVQISYDDFMAMTEEERNTGKWLVTGMGSLSNAYNIDYKNDKTIGQELDTINSYTLASRERSNITNRLDDLSQAISEQNLEKYGYKIGDYFVGASGYYYYLADLDTFYGGYASYATVATHHVGVVVDTKATSAYLSSDTLSGYSTSTLHDFLKGTVLTNIKSDFTALFGSWNDHLIPHTKLYNTVSSWAWSGTNDNTEYISALTEVQMYGCPIWSGNNYQQGEGGKQLELFRKYNFNDIYGNVSIWLRSIYSASSACFASIHGGANHDSLSYAYRASGLILMY